MMSRLLLYLLLAAVLVLAVAPRNETWRGYVARHSAHPRPSATSVSPAGSGQSNGLAGTADLDMVRNGAATDVYVINRLAGPVQAELFFTAATNIQSLPSLPLRQVLGPRTRILLSRIESLPSATPVSSYALGLRTIPGDPRAFPEDVSYSLPVDEGSGWELGQAFHGGFSHSDEQNRFAVDFIVDPGTPVLAARSGTVMEVMSGFNGNSLNRRDYAERANFIRILHEDGSMAIYAHLQENGVLVAVGDRVALGQEIGISGNTGFSSGPHLHFCLQINTGMRLVSVPFKMVGPNGFLPLPPN